MFLKVSFECRRKAGVPGEKPAEASMDRKPNAHKAAGTGTRTRDLIGARQPASPSRLSLYCFVYK